MSNKQELNDEEKIDLVVQLAKSNMIKFRINEFFEIEIIPTGFDWKHWWFLLQTWNIDQKDIELFHQVVERLNKGNFLAKHIKTE